MALDLTNSLIGIARRIDRGADGNLHITDIKTGGSSSFSDLGEDDPVMGGTKMQLPVYAYAALQLIGPTDAPVEAMLLVCTQGPGQADRGAERMMTVLNRSICGP